MLHLRIVAPPETADRVLDLLCGSPSVVNVIRLERAAAKPKGDVILCDVTREDASVILGDLRELDIPRTGSIAVENVDSALSDAAVAAERATRGQPSDAVVWRRSSSGPASRSRCRSASWPSWRWRCRSPRSGCCSTSRS
jgi:hypothetical protein